MRSTVKILLFCVAFVLLTGCSAQRRAERKIRRAIDLCPELVQMKAHPIDTVLSVPAFVDRAVVPVNTVLAGDSVVAETRHGTITVSIGKEDNALHVTYEADPQQIRYQDTLKYSQVTIEQKQPEKGWFGGFGERLAEWVSFMLFGMAVACYLIRTKRTNNKEK